MKNSANLLENKSKTHPQNHLINSFIFLCQKENVEGIKKFLQKNSFGNKTQHALFDKCLTQACKNGRLNIVQFLLTDPSLKIHTLANTNMSEGFRFAVKFKHLPIVQYLLSSPELPSHADIHAFHDEAIKSACENRDYPMMQYLLTSTELKEKASIHIQKDIIFKYLYGQNEFKTIEFLILKCNFKETSHVTKILETSNNSQKVYKIFQLKKQQDLIVLKDKLEQQLEVTNSVSRKNKI